MENERPIIVIRKFNKNFFWGVLISSKRLIRKVGMVNKKDFGKIQDGISNLIKNDSRINK